MTQAEMSETAVESVNRGTKFLIKNQRTDGAIYHTTGTQHATTMTSLAILALLSSGHTPTEHTLEGEALRKALPYVLDSGVEYSQFPGSIYFGQKDNSRMYGHGITTLMLSQIAGMTKDEEMDAKVSVA